MWWWERGFGCQHEKRAECCFPRYTWRYNGNYWTGDAGVSIVCMIKWGWWWWWEREFGGGTRSVQSVVSLGILEGIMGTTGPETQQPLLFVWSDIDLAKHLFDSIQWFLIKGRLLHVEAQHETTHHFAEPQYSLTVSIVEHFYLVIFHFHCYSSSEACSNRRIIYTET